MMKVATLLIVLASCGDASGRKADLGEYDARVPRRGVYLRTSKADVEHWRAVFDADKRNIMVYGSWIKDGKPKEMRLSPQSADQLWGLATSVLSSSSAPAWRHVPDMRVELAVGDEKRGLVVNASGMFVDGDALKLYDAIHGWVPEPPADSAPPTEPK